jgi:hypothetical protein
MKLANKPYAATCQALTYQKTTLETGKHWNAFYAPGEHGADPSFIWIIGSNGSRYAIDSFSKLIPGLAHLRLIVDSLCMLLESIDIKYGITVHGLAEDPTYSVVAERMLTDADMIRLSKTNWDEVIKR